MAQFTTVDMKNHLLRTGADIPSLKSLERKYLPKLEKSMNENCQSGGTLHGYSGPMLTPGPEEQAAAHRAQAKRIEKQAACQRKAEKKAARLDQQKQADRLLAIDTLADTCQLSPNYADRVEAAKALLVAHGFVSPVDF